MATRKKRGSRRRHPKKKIVYFDGYEMRQQLPDLDITLWHGKNGMVESDFIPKDEIWIDSRYEAEKEFLLAVHRVETMRRFAREIRYEKIRDYMKAKLCEKGPIPPFVERKEWNPTHQLTIWYVRGDIVRRWLDPAFIFGGHDLIYPSYIDVPRTVWVDVRQDPREIKYTLLHEMTERKLMEKGWSYDDAHGRATDVELQARARKNLIWPARKERYLIDAKLSPLSVDLLGQEGDTTCGPASLRMYANYLGLTYRGKPYSEKRLCELSSCGEEGTDHRNLVKAAKAMGTSVFVKENGTIDELRHFVLKERLPVLIGWWSGKEQPIEKVQKDHDLDEGHFSLVTHVNKTHVWITDPWVWEEERPGVRRVTIRKFMRMWHDTDTPAYLPVKHWYMVLNVEGRTYRLPGGANY